MKKKMMTMLAVCLSAVLMTGCGAGSKSTMSESMAGNWSASMDSMEFEMNAGDMGGSYYGESMEEGSARATENGQIWTDRKLIRNVNLEVETKEYDAMMSSLETQIQGLGGYIENMDSYNGSNYSGYRNSRYANLTIRIPQTKMDTFLAVMPDICNVVRRSDSVDDVTLTYVDMESHRDALKTEQTRLLELLEQAESLEDILTIEERLTTVRYQLESMESQLRAMDNQVQFSTVYLSISEVKELTPVEEVEETAWQRISEGFMHSLRSIGHGFAEFGIWFVIHIPQLAIWAAVITAIVLLIKRHRKKKAAQKTAKEAAATAGQNHTK